MILFSLSYKNKYVPKINFVLCKKFIRTKFSFAPPAFPTKNKYKCKQIYYIIRTAKLQAFFQKNCNPPKKERNGIGKVGIQAADSPILRFYLPFFSFFKKSCPTISKPEKDILEIRLTECLFFAIIGWGHKKMKLFCTQYARPSRHCFKKNVYLFANDDKTMLRIFSVFLQKTSWNTSGGFL